MVPVVRDARAGLARYQGRISCANGVRLPSFTDVMSDLDGLVDADAHVEIARAAPPTMGGTIAFQQGTIQLNRMGEQFDDVSGKDRFSPRW